MRMRKFGFPDDPPIFRPSRVMFQINAAGVISTFLAVGLLVGAVVNAVMCVVMLHRADSVPYVVDGGQFGCRVPPADVGGHR